MGAGLDVPEYDPVPDPAQPTNCSPGAARALRFTDVPSANQPEEGFTNPAPGASGAATSSNWGVYVTSTLVDAPAMENEPEAGGAAYWGCGAPGTGLWTV